MSVGPWKIHQVYDRGTTPRYINTFLIFVLFCFIFKNKSNTYNVDVNFQCKKCAEGCDDCVDFSPCIATYDIILRITILLLTLLVIGFLPMVAVFTYKYSDLKVRNVAHKRYRFFFLLILLFWTQIRQSITGYPKEYDFF